MAEEKERIVNHVFKASERWSGHSGRNVVAAAIEAEPHIGNHPTVLVTINMSMSDVDKLRADGKRSIGPDVIQSCMVAMLGMLPLEKQCSIVAHLVDTHNREHDAGDHEPEEE